MLHLHCVPTPCRQGLSTPVDEEEADLFAYLCLYHVDTVGLHVSTSVYIGPRI
jgi:hypothetical protein